MSFAGIIQSGKSKLLIGRLRHRIDIVKPTKVQDSTGGWSVNTNNVVITTWGTVEALSAAEKWAAHEFAAVVTHKVIIRHPRTAVAGSGSFDQGITADMQVWYNKRQFQIEGVLNPDERPDVLVLICAEIDDSKNQAQTPQESTL